MACAAQSSACPSLHFTLELGLDGGAAPWRPLPRWMSRPSKPLTLPRFSPTSSLRPRSRTTRGMRPCTRLRLELAAQMRPTRSFGWCTTGDGQSAIKVLPTFVSLFAAKNTNGLVSNMPGLHYDPKLILHGQQYIEIYKPIPSRAKVTNKIKVAGLHDRGKAAVLELETLTCLEGSGEILCMNRSSIFLRGAGGFSDSSEPFSYAAYPANEVPPVTFQDSKPFAVYEDRTQKSQALLCGMCSYFDPLHSDSIAAQAAGFSRPILPGLGTLGFAVRAVMRSFCNMEPKAVKTISCRFLHHVYPGETLVTEMWPQGQRVNYRTKVKERGRAVLSGYVLLDHIPSSL